MREWPEYDFDLLIHKWGLVDKPCWAGVDASWTTDLTAVVFVFPPFDGGETWTLLPFFWMPQERVAELERVCRVPHSTWIRQGFIEATAGNGIDMRAVKQRIHWGRELFELREMPFDRFNFRTQAMELLDEGIEAVEITQSFLHLSHPTKFLLSAYVDQKIRHGNNPVLNWMASCLQLQYDHKDNCQPSKPERGKSAKRIDGIAATVTALARATVAQDNTITYTGLPSVGGCCSRSTLRTIKKPPPSRAAAWEPGEPLLRDLVSALAGLVLSGLDLERVLLGGCGEESPNAVRLPVGRLHDLGQGRSLGPSDQRQDLRAFALGAGRAGFLGAGGPVSLLGPLGGCGRLLRGGCLLGRLGLCRRALGGLCATVGLGFRLRL